MLPLLSNVNPMPRCHVVMDRVQDQSHAHLVQMIEKSEWVSEPARPVFSDDARFPANNK